MLIKLDGGTIAFLSLIASIVSAIAAIFAAFYSRKAATRDDLARVEQDTQHAEHFSNKILSIDTPINPQEKQEDSQAPAQPKPSPPQDERRFSPVQQEASLVQARQEASQAHPHRIPISVEGEAMGEAPLELFLTLQDSSARVSRLERLGEAGKSLGSSPCKPTDNAQVFKCILPQEKVRQWWDAGESTSEGGARGVLRVYMLPDASGKEVQSDVPVSIVEGLRNVGIATLVVWTIKGSV